jgi:hypothetical protein
MYRRLAVALLALTVSPALAQERKPPPRVKLTLSFPVKEFDPEKPGKAVVRCVVRNDTVMEVEVPEAYDGRKVVLRSGKLSLRPNRLPGRIRTVRLEPGRQRTLFELRLADVLLRTDRKDARWQWVPGHLEAKGPPPPPARAPIYDARGHLLRQAEFRCDLYLTPAAPLSDKAVLRLRSEKK